MNLVQFRVMSPNNTCLGVYNGGLSSVATGNHTLNLITPVSCLNNPNTSNDKTSGADAGVSGNYGFFNAQFGGVGSDLTSGFSSENPNGTWKIIFSESTVGEPGCVTAASLSFGDPTVSNQESNGENCSNAINFTGSPICASTSGKAGSSLMPGSLSGPNGVQFGTIGGATCDWNGANNNDVWIKFTPTSANVCISISGLDFNLQSVIATDANVDGDNDH